MATSATSSADASNREPEGIRIKPTKKRFAGKSMYYRPMPDGSTTAVTGHRYHYASNIAHADDIQVTVEDLSQIDIDPAIQAMFERVLPLLLRSLASELADSNTTVAVRDDKTCEIEDFCSSGLQIHRRTYKELDVYSADPNHYSRNTIALRINEDRKQHFDGIEPSLSLVQWVMAEILAEQNGVHKGRESDKWGELAAEAHGRLYQADINIEAARRQEITNEMGRTPTEVREYWVHVRKNEHKYKRTPNRHYQLQIDRASAKVCERVDDKDIVILRDKNHILIAGTLGEATQKCFAKGTLEKLAKAIEAFAWRHPISEPDPSRHGTHYDDHLLRHPEKDIERSDNPHPHHVAGGTDHYGNNHASGHSGTRDLQRQELAHGRYPTPGVRNSPAFTVELPKLKDGVWGVSEKEVRLTLKAWDPELYERLLRIRQLIPPSIRVRFATTGDNPHTFLAQLYDVQTEGHVDESDMKYGLAAIKCFGDFTGGDLVLKELGVRIPYRSGSHGQLRGSELHHFVDIYEGTRHCLVLTTKETVVKAVKMIEKRMEELRIEADALRSKKPETLTAEERRLVIACEDDDALSEYVYQEAKAAPKAKSAKTLAREAKKGAQVARQEVNGTKAAKRDNYSEDEEQPPKKVQKRGGKANQA